jgi:integrase
MSKLGWFFAACTDDERLIYQFFLMTGFREEEVMYVSSRCTDFENATVTVRHNPAFAWTPKMYKERTVPIPRGLLEKLKRMVAAPEVSRFPRAQWVSRNLALKPPPTTERSRIVFLSVPFGSSIVTARS